MRSAATLAHLTVIAGALLLAGCIPPGARAPVEGPYPAQRDSAPPPYRPVPEQEAPAAPAWEARPVAPDLHVVEQGTYTVRSGDTLRGISNRTGAGSEAIARANNLAPPFTIFPGQHLVIPGGRYHMVRDGETGIAIARAYGVDWSRVVSENDLDEPYVLRVGQRIRIPETGPETPEQRAARFHIDIDDIVTGGEPALAGNERPAQPGTSPARVPPATTPVAAPARFAGGFQWPLSGAVIGKFGPVASGERNDGIKIAAPLDTPVLAAADGTVGYVGSDIPSLGGVIILKHGDNWTSVYGHVSQLVVKRGQSVKKGQLIALSGNSGNATRPQLHFEVLRGRTPVDPLPLLPPR
ncbi:MAG: peptidoglycan DD-metalloendopeptidase family protein [Pseudomonadota bacterium]